MNEQLQYAIDSELKNEYDTFILEEYGFKRNRCGPELEKALKFYLAAKGNNKYQKDPEVQAIFEKAKEKFQEKPETISSSNSLENSTIEERLERKLEEKLEEKFAQFEKKARRESSKRHGHADFKKQFQMAFQDYNQVSRKDLEHFIMNHADIVDSRSIRSRIQYLESNGVIETYAPNVYDILF